MKTVKVKFNIESSHTIEDLRVSIGSLISDMHYKANDKDRKKFDIFISTKSIYRNKNIGIIEFGFCEEYDSDTLNEILEKTTRCKFERDGVFTSFFGGSVSEDKDDYIISTYKYV